MIGRKILHYNIIEKLGEGGMGEVYLAEDAKLHRRVALKFLHGDFEKDADARDRLFREARAASKLSHPNIVAVHAIEEAEGHVFIAMEHVEGESLRDLVRRLEVGPDRAIDIAEQILAALANAHETGVVHRDIKSDNIIVSAGGRVKVLDFGLAKARGSVMVTRYGSSAGTPAYMSPEQIQGQNVDHRSDLFSFGVVLYEMLTARMPFKGEHESAVTYSIVNETPESLDAYAAGLPDGLQAVVDRALEKNPEKRYQSAVEILADLARVKAGARVAGAGRRAARGRPVRFPFIVVAAIAVIAAALWTLRGRVESPAPVVESARAQRTMVAVLPFENLGPTDQEYFADGVTEEITTQLAKLSGLGVISRTSAAQYKQSEKSLRTVGEELGVDYVLEGSIRWERSGGTDRVRITAQLIRTADDTHLWAETYDRVYDQIFELQSEIARNVAGALDVTLLEPEEVALETRPTENLDAYDAYLKGRELYDGAQTIRDIDRATELIEASVKLDSTFSHAQAMLARIYANDFFNHRKLDRPRLEQARRAAQAALRDAPDQPEGHLAMGYYYYYGGRDYDRALSEFAMAEKQQPNNSDLHEAMGYVLRRQGRWEESVKNLEQSVELDPHSLDKASNYIQTLLMMRRYDEADKAIERCERVTRAPQLGVFKALRYMMNPTDVTKIRSALDEAGAAADAGQVKGFRAQVEILARNYDEVLRVYSHPGAWESMDTLDYYTTRALVYHLKGDDDRMRVYADSARVFAEERLATAADNPNVVGQLGITYTMLRDFESATRYANRAVELMPLSKDAVAGVDPLVNRSVVNMIAGNADAAMDDLERVTSVPSTITPSLLRVHPLFDIFRDNPRFQKLVAEKVNS